MEENNFQKFSRHLKAKGFFYAVGRGFKYLGWRIKCIKMGVDWKKFSRKDTAAGKSLR